jgi:DNA polymerase III alpha subunit
MLYRFPCGCQWPMLEEPEDVPDGCLPYIDIDVELAPENCPATWGLLGRGDTKGVFQLESPLGRQWTKKLKPENGEHIGALGAILRPGCLQAVDGEGVSATQHYVRRKNGLEPVKSVHPAVDAILFPTYGVMVYQEQAMAIAQAVAGFNLQDADVLRKAIGKKLPEEMAKCEKMFLEGAERTGVVPMDLAKYLFEQIKESQRYSFNKSHSICYGLTGYECAYLKAHIPVSFFASWLLNSRHKKSKGGPKQEVFELVNDARLFDVKVEPPRLARLERFVYTDRTSVFFGLSNVSGIGPNVVVKVCDTVREAEKAAGSPMAKWTWMQFLLRLGGDLPISSLTRLIQVGAVPYENMQRTRQLVEFEAWTALTDRERGWIGANAAGAKTVMEAIGLLAQPRYVKPERVRRPKAGMEAETKRLQEDYDREDISKEDAKANRAAYRKVTEMYQEPEPKGPFGGCATESRRTTVLGIIRMLERPATAMVDSPLRIACWEEELLGISITYARIDGCDISDVNATCKECVSGRTGSLVLGVDVQEVRETKTKKGKNPGQKMGRMVLSDNTCAINAVCFPNEWKEFQHLFVKDNSLIVQGEREKNNDYDSFIVKRAWQASQSVSGA